MKNKSLFHQLKEQFFQHNRFSFSMAAGVSLLMGFGGVIVSWILKSLIDTASGTAGAVSLRENLMIVAAYLVFMILFSMLDYTFKPAFIRKAMTQYKDFAFRKLTEKSISSFRDESTAAYLSALTNDATSVEANYLSSLMGMFTKLVMFCGSVALMLLYSPILTAVAVGVTILPLAASLLAGRRMEAAEKRVSGQNMEFTAALTDCLNGFSVVKSFRAEKEIFRLFAGYNRALENEKLSKRRIQAFIGMIGALAGMGAQFGVFVAGTYLALTGQGMTAGTIIMFVNLMNFMIQPASDLPGLLAGRKAALGLIRKLADELEKNSEATGTEEIRRLSREIRLEDVSFRYDAEKEVLHSLDAAFRAGGAYAVVGASGSGKSTLLNLLMSPGLEYAGNILLDGKELRSIRAESLYELISVIQQNVFVFNASIRDNVTMFRDFPEEVLDDVIRRAHLDSLIAERGENTLCGENGKGLSGGEKQRISIARSLLKKSSILLADEATAALDAQTAWQVSNDILDLAGITRIVVTHSLEEALLRRYDGILVLKDGQVTESGTFDELMERKGYFHALFTVAQ